MNTQTLFRLIRNNENAKGFYLTLWFSTSIECGTIGCLVGNDALMSGNEQLRLSLLTCHTDPYIFPAKEYGISRMAAAWLFGPYKTLRGGGNRNPDDREAAINRVRKYVYWKLHRQEMMYDERGCVRETIRRAEGNHMVARQVLAAVERRERELVR